jgi:hypothetical protein
MFNLNTIIMKVFKNYCFLSVFVLAFIIFSCYPSEETSSSDTNNNDTPNQNVATWIRSDEHSKGFSLRLRFMLGHTAQQCGNRCITVLGQSFHIDCRGFGNICNRVVRVVVHEDENTHELSLTIIDEDDILGGLEIFPFPDRSLYITNPQNNTELWLNIPEQILSMDDLEEEIIIHNVWFSEEQELENL